MADKIDLKMQNILKIKVGFWKRLSTMIYAWIFQDMKAGQVQAIVSQKTATSGGASQYSQAYKKYKMNYMKRFTTRKYKKGTKNIAAGTTTSQGTNLKAYEGVSLKSNSGTPNMLLTGQTIEGLEYERSTDTSLTMKYKDKDSKKIIYNEEMGRVITTLNEKNIDKTLKLIEDELAKNISEWYRGKIIINVGN